jgi:hypothetical protein
MIGTFLRRPAAIAALFVAGRTLAAADAPAAEFHRGIDYHGAAAFFSLETVTVVYPAGPGEPVDVNRRSAEARARWLAAVHRMRAVVAADDQVTEEQKKGNVLLLGWNNRVLGTPGGPARPFQHDERGTTLLDLPEPDPKVDLLLFHRNPMNWNSFLLFWSRIDPERDRFSVLPRVGSDWAMYRDFRVIRQGMFVPARVWPPARDKVAEGDHSAEASIRPGGTATFDSEHYHITFERTKFTDADVHAIASAREAALAKAATAVGSMPTGLRILLFVYANEEDKQAATGVADPTHSIASNREIHAVKRFALSGLARDEIHILAREAFGPCTLTAIHDGYALALEPMPKGQEMETRVATLRAAGKLPDVAALLDEERLRALPPDEASTGAGVLMTWLRQSFGAAGVKKAYGLRDGTPAALAAALGTSETALEASYASWADACAAAHAGEVAFLAAENEAQQRRLTSDWPGMVAALQKALKAKPGDPQTLFNLASAQMRADDLAGAEASLKAVLAAPLAPADSRFRIFGHYQLGRVYDLGGRRKEALAEYDAVLALPDEHGAHALASERKASPATKEQLE